MNRPLEIAAVLLQILGQGILRARAAAWSGDSRRCAIEADHIHNLPDLLRNYSTERLQYYWEMERPSFLAAAGSGANFDFEPLWQKIGETVTAPALNP
jgi:hypothetical protein